MIIESKKVILASGPVIVNNNKVLLNKHGDDTFYKFCGGRMEEDESLTEIAKREVMEEMGIEINILNNEPYIMYVKKEKEGNTTDVVLVHFLAEMSNKEQEIKPGEDIREWDWIDINNLPENDLAPNILPTLKHFGFIE